MSGLHPKYDGRLSIFGKIRNGVVYIAHRGGALRYPENTDEGFTAANADGQILLECDVRELSDGELGIFHGETIDSVTTGTGNTADQNAAAFEALTIDAGSWFGGGYGNLSPILFSDFLSSHKGSGNLLFPELKYPTSGDTEDYGNAAVAALDAAGVPSRKCLIQSFSATPLGPIVDAGYQACIIESATTSQTIATIQAAGIEYAALSNTLSDARIGAWLTAGFNVFVWTINRRSERDRILALGVHGIVTDDPEYLSSDIPIATSDNFASQEWQAGMVPYNSNYGVEAGTHLTATARGRFSDTDAWGYDDSGVFDYRGCLQGWACPINSDPAADEYVIDFKVTHGAVSGGSQTRWAGISIAATDDKFTDGSQGGTFSDHVDSYLFVLRKNGTIQIYRRAFAAGVLLSESTGGTAISDDETVRYQLEVNETKLQIRRLNGSGTVVQTATSFDVTPGYRGGYFHLGHSWAPALFRDISITASTAYNLWTAAQEGADLWFAPESEYTGGTWRDISGNTDHFTQGTAGNQPTASTVGSLAALDFDGTTDFLDAPAAALDTFNDVNKAWVLAVYRHDVADVSDTERPLYTAANNSTASRVYLGVGSTTSGAANKIYFGGRRLDADSFAYSGFGPALTAGQVTILLGYMDWTARTAEIWLDGEQEATASSLWTGSGNTSATDSASMRIGGNTGASPIRFLNGRVAELVVGTSELSSDDIDKLFGWAAHKHGLEGNLPGDHPYKSTAPTA